MHTAFAHAPFQQTSATAAADAADAAPGAPSAAASLERVNILQAELREKFMPAFLQQALSTSMHNILTKLEVFKTTTTNNNTKSLTSVKLSSQEVTVLLQPLYDTLQSFFHFLQAFPRFTIDVLIHLRQAHHRSKEVAITSSSTLKTEINLISLCCLVYEVICPLAAQVQKNFDSANGSAKSSQLPLISHLKALLLQLLFHLFKSGIATRMGIDVNYSTNDSATTATQTSVLGLTPQAQSTSQAAATASTSLFFYYPPIHKNKGKQAATSTSFMTSESSLLCYSPAEIEEGCEFFSIYFITLANATQQFLGPPPSTPGLFPFPASFASTYKGYVSNPNTKHTSLLQKLMTLVRLSDILFELQKQADGLPPTHDHSRRMGATAAINQIDSAGELIGAPSLHYLRDLMANVNQDAAKANANSKAPMTAKQGNKGLPNNPPMKRQSSKEEDSAFESSLVALRDMFPPSSYSVDFLRACLNEYNGNYEATLTSILEHSLPTYLQLIKDKRSYQKGDELLQDKKRKEGRGILDDDFDDDENKASDLEAQADAQFNQYLQRTGRITKKEAEELKRQEQEASWINRFESKEEAERIKAKISAQFNVYDDEYDDGYDDFVSFKIDDSNLDVEDHAEPQPHLSVRARHDDMDDDEPGARPASGIDRIRSQWRQDEADREMKLAEKKYFTAFNIAPSRRTPQQQKDLDYWLNLHPELKQDNNNKNNNNNNNNNNNKKQHQQQQQQQHQQHQQQSHQQQNNHHKKNQYPSHSTPSQPPRDGPGAREHAPNKAPSSSASSSSSSSSQDHPRGEPSRRGLRGRGGIGPANRGDRQPAAASSSHSVPQPQSSGAPDLSRIQFVEETYSDDDDGDNDNQGGGGGGRGGRGGHGGNSAYDRRRKEKNKAFSANHNRKNLASRKGGITFQ